MELYTRTGIKKGVIELYWSKLLGKAYGDLYSATTDEDYIEKAKKFEEIAKLDEYAKNDYESAMHKSPDVALISQGYKDELISLLLKRLKEPLRRVDISFSSKINETQPILIIPSGGLYGLEDSPLFKTSLDEYVKDGGTLIVFAQQHGYEYSILPTPDGKPITSYGWVEDRTVLQMVYILIHIIRYYLLFQHLQYQPMLMDILQAILKILLFY